MHRQLFYATVIVLGFSLAAPFGSMPAPDPGDQAQTRQPYKLPDWPAIDLLWWIRR